MENKIKIRKIIISSEIVVMILTALVTILVRGIVIKNQEEKVQIKKDDYARYSVLLDGAKDGEVTVECILDEDNKTCLPMYVSGIFMQGKAGFLLKSKEADLEIDGDKFKIIHTGNIEKSADTVDDRLIRLFFKNENGEKIYEYSLMIHTKINDESIAKLKQIEERQAEEERQQEERKIAEDAQKAIENAANERVRKLKTCQISTSEWTDDESAAYWSEYLSCSNKEHQKTQADWQKTAPSSSTAYELCRKALQQQYPYGVKIHYLAGVITDSPESADTRFYKVKVDVTNVYGATRSTVAECRVQNAGNNMVRLIHFYVY